MALDHHFSLMVDSSMVQRVLEIFPEPVAWLNLRVQSRLSLGAINCRPDAVVTSLDQFGVGSSFDEPFFDAFSKHSDRPRSEKRVTCSFLPSVEARLQPDSHWDSPIL